MTLAIIGAIVLQATNRLAIPCSAGRDPRTGPGACSGASALAHHIDGAVTLFAITCAALAAAAFVWYMLWGYKSTGQAGGNRDAAGPS